ncbi:hypothetical protein IWX92DRAFT_83332 [Phyllosticta citricarpa]
MADTFIEKATAEHIDADERASEDVNLNSNVEAKIKNPLAGISKSLLLSQVEDFAKEKDMVDKMDLLKRGALVAQNPSEFETIEGLSEDERSALLREVTHKCTYVPKCRLTSQSIYRACYFPIFSERKVGARKRRPAAPGARHHHPHP